MGNHICERCGEGFRTLSRLRLHQEDCEDSDDIPSNIRVKALENVGTGSNFQSILDRRRFRISQNDVGSIEEAVCNLRQSIRAMGSEELLRELWYHELIRAGSYATLNEDTGISPKMVEYLFGLAVTIPPTDRSPTAGFYDVLDALSLVLDCFRVKQYETLAEADTIPEKRRAHVQQLLLERELTTGRYGHARQRREFARRVYTTLDNELSDEVGFSATETISAGDAISKRMIEILGDNRLIPIAKRIIDVGNGPFQIQMADVSPSSDNPLALSLLAVAKYDNYRMDPVGSEYDEGEYIEYESKFGNLRESAPKYSLRPEDIGAETIEDSSHLKFILDELSVSIGSWDSDLDDLTGAIEKFDYPFDHNPIHQYPLVKNRDGDYYIGPQNTLWYSFSTRFRYDLLGSQHHGHGVNTIGEEIESWVVECIENIKDEDVTVLTSVDYDFEDGESDVVLLFDDTMVVIECKTRGLRLKSRLGPFGPFENISDDVEEILEEPYKQQAMKLINAVKDGHVSELNANEGTVQVSKSDFKEYIPAVILGEPLDSVSTMLYPDLMEFAGEEPYFTDVFSWQTICRNLSGSQDLVLYLRKRIEVGVTGRAFSTDENDYLGAYLDHGIEYPDIPDRGMVDIHHVGSHLEREYEAELGTNMESL